MRKKSVIRFREILGVFASYGFGYIIDSKFNKHENSPKNLRKAFEELGSTFIKIGQVLSTRPDIVPEEYTKELSKLQDSINNEETFESIKLVFQGEFNQDIEKVFQYINPKPLASASIAQVYEAVLKDGREVVVKIQRPGIAEKINLDIHILKRLIKLAKFNKDKMLVDPIEAIEQIEEQTNSELDFVLEKENINKFRKFNLGVACIYAPEVIEEYSGHKVITMENIKGFKITDIQKIQQYGYDRYDIGKKLALSFFKQVFDDGFFHGDPHPGNILIREGKICYIDFGAVGILTDAIKKALNDAIIGVATKDTNRIVNFIISVGIKRGKIDRNTLYMDVQYLLDIYLSTSIKNIKISVLLEEIIEIATRNNIQLPKDFVMLAKGSLIIEGVIAEIAPELDMLDIIIPFVKSKNKYYFKDELDAEKLLLRAYNFIKSSSELPSKLIDLSDSLTQGRAKVQLEFKGVDKTIREINKMVNRVVFGVVVAAMFISTALVLNSNMGPKIRGISIIGVGGYAISSIFGLYLLISIIRSGNLK